MKAEVVKGLCYFEEVLYVQIVRDHIFFYIASDSFIADNAILKSILSSCNYFSSIQ